MLHLIPTGGYDLDKIEGDTITVRPAIEGEQFRAVGVADRARLSTGRDLLRRRGRRDLLRLETTGASFQMSAGAVGRA